MAFLSRESLFAFAALFTVFLPATSPGQDAIQLFHKMQTALGGGDKIAAIQGFEQCVRADTWDNSGKRHGEVYKEPGG